MYYTAKNANFLINGKQIVCSDLKLSHYATLEPQYLLNDRSTTEYYSDDNVLGNCEFSYYLTGQDFIKSYIQEEDTLISGNLAGLYFISGKLKSYSLTCSPNSPVIAKAAISFFNCFSGSFSPTTPQIETYPLLNMGDVTVTSLNTYTTETLTNINNFSYSFDSEIQPVYLISEDTDLNSIHPNRIIYGRKTTKTDITCDSLDSHLPFIGKNAGVKITFNHPQIPSLSESITCSGRLFQKNIEVTADNLVLSQVSIIENHANLPPFIDSFTPETANYGDIITVYGKNFSTVDSVWVYFQKEEFKGEQLNVIDDNTLTFRVSQEAHTGPIIIRNLWGKTQSVTNLTLTANTLAIHSTSKAYAEPGTSITIYGDNLNSVTNISFGGIPAQNFSVINNSEILSVVPTGAKLGELIVGSNFTLQTGGLSYHFAITPKISGFSPVSGIRSDVISISGDNFTGINTIYFNNLLATGYTVQSPQLITTYVPSGYTKGQITIYDSFGLSGVSSETFQPYLRITGINILSGLPYTVVRISGYNFDTSLLCASSPGYYKVGFNKNYTGFKYISNILLTGMVPSGNITGPIEILQADGASTYPSTYIWRSLFQPIPITGYPTGAYSGQYLNFTLSGNGLFSLTGIKLSGISPNNNTEIININSYYINSDTQGTYALISGFPLSNIQTGRYDIIALNTVKSGVLTGYLTITKPVNRAREYAVRCYSSSTGYTGSPYPFLFSPEYAIDGVSNTNGAIAQTNYEARPFWEIKFLKSYSLSSIVIYPYTTGAAIVALTGITGAVYDNSKALVWSGWMGTLNNPHTINLPAATTGRYFRLYSDGTGKISVGEVEVYSNAAA